MQITDKSQCCGCTACVAVCPKQCIVMKEDNEGFLYPQVVFSLCIDCNLCQKVCPILNQADESKPSMIYAAKNRNEIIRKISSSGGLFTLFAEKIIDEGGVVFGARFDENWEVMHDCTETKEGLAAFRGSKYVQSRMGDCYVRVRQYLNTGRKVMFTGTSCQIAGLKNYLRKEYENLLTIDVVCHGVPSPKVWRLYLEELITLKGEKKAISVHSIHDRNVWIKDISFRDKCSGWKKYSFTIILSEVVTNGENNTILLSSAFTDNIYMNLFLSNLDLRPSCYKCPAKLRAQSDITIADFWGIENVLPEFDDDKGISAVLMSTEKGIYWFNRVLCNCVMVPYESVIRANPSIFSSVKRAKNRDFFFYQINHGNTIEEAYLYVQDMRWQRRIRRLFFGMIGI